MRRSDAARRLGPAIRVLVLALLGCGWATSATAAELQVWSAGAVEPGLLRRSPAGALAFIGFVMTPSAKQQLVATGVE
jgi:hypothetical protein